MLECVCERECEVESKVILVRKACCVVENWIMERVNGDYCLRGDILIPPLLIRYSWLLLDGT